MVYIIRTIVALLIPLVINFSAIGLVSTTPEDAVEDFMDGIKTQQTQLMGKYKDNAYVNLLCSVKGDKKTVKRMNDALFNGFSYKIEKVATKDSGVAVAKVVVKNKDFSNVLNEYNAAAYSYIMANLYTDEVADKEALNDVCLELYVTEIEKAAAVDEKLETVVFIPMVDDGYYGWNIIMSDELMLAVMGNLQMPIQ